MTISIKKYFPFILAIVLHLIVLIPLSFNDSSLETEINTQLNELRAHSISVNLNAKKEMKIQQLSQPVKNLNSKSSVINLNNQNQEPTFSNNLNSNIENINLDELNKNEAGLIFDHIEVPNYPKIARMNNIEGTIKIKIYFQDGVVKNTIILESSQQKILDNTVLESIKKWTIKKKGQIEMTKTFVFKLN